MPIQVTCECGAKMSAKDELAGKTAKCPKCGQPLLIAAAEQAGTSTGMADLFEESGMRAGVARCPGCGAEMLDDAVLCVMCGFDLRRGHRLKTRSGSTAELDDEDLGDLTFHGNPHLDHAERQLARDKKQQKNLSKGVPWWLVMLAFVGLISFVVAMVSIPQEKAMETSGIVLQVAGGILAGYFLIRIAVVAFQESPLSGLLFIVLLPLYGVYFIFTRWDRVGPLLVLGLGGGLVFGLGVVLALVAPMLKAKPSEDVAFHFQQRRPAVVRVVMQLPSDAKSRLPGADAG